MATHAKGDGGPARLNKLLAYHEAAAAAIRLTMDLLNGSAKAAKTNGHASVLAEAVALDSARVAKKPKGRRPRDGSHTREKTESRGRTARILEHIATHGPLTAAAINKVEGTRIPFGPLVYNGFLKKVRSGYKRTAKPFEVDWRTARV
jgi:hypothetical protein